MLEQELRKALHGGSKRCHHWYSGAIVTNVSFIDERVSGRAAFCEIGFWQVTKKEAWFSMLNSETSAPPAYLPQRHAVPVNVIKARYTDQTHNLRQRTLGTK